MKWGDFELHLVSDGSLWLDGGAMFGAIPKPLWSRKTPADEQNRIQLATNCLLVRTGRETILIDTGCGHKYTEKQRAIYRIEHERELVADLARLGVVPEAIDLVINTHFHFDHCGGNTRKSSEGIVPTFVNADYVVRRREYEDAEYPDDRSRSSYVPDNWRPIADRGQLKLVDEDRELVPGIQLVLTPGHTAGHQSVLVTSGGNTLCYIADLCSTSAHVPLVWFTGFDLYPLTTMETRRRIYRQAVEENWLLVFVHDPRVPAGYLIQEDGAYKLRPFDWRE